MYKSLFSICLSLFLIGSVLLCASEDKPVYLLANGNGTTSSQKEEGKADSDDEGLDFFFRTYIGCNFILDSNEITSRSPQGFSLEDGFDAEIALGLGLLIGDSKPDKRSFIMQKQIEFYARYFFTPDIEQGELESQIIPYSDHLKIGARYIVTLDFPDVELPVGIGGGIDLLFPEEEIMFTVENNKYFLGNLENKINPYVEISIPWIVELNTNYTFGINKFSIEVGLNYALELLLMLFFYKG